MLTAVRTWFVVSVGTFIQVANGSHATGSSVDITPLNESADAHAEATRDDVVEIDHLTALPFYDVDSFEPLVTEAKHDGVENNQDQPAAHNPIGVVTKMVRDEEGDEPGKGAPNMIIVPVSEHIAYADGATYVYCSHCNRHLDEPCDQHGHLRGNNNHYAVTSTDRSSSSCDCCCVIVPSAHRRRYHHTSSSTTSCFCIYAPDGNVCPRGSFCCCDSLSNGVTAACAGCGDVATNCCNAVRNIDCGSCASQMSGGCMKCIGGIGDAVSNCGAGCVQCCGAAGECLANCGSICEGAAACTSACTVM